MIDQTAYEAIRPELVGGETVLWAGRPNPSIIFHREDLGLIPFSLLWGGFAIFWEASVLGLTSAGHGGHRAPLFFSLWGIPFIVAGQYLIWGRFLAADWKKRRTFYAVTNRRVLVLQKTWKNSFASAFLDGLPMLTRESGPRGSGTLRFSPAPSMMSQRSRFELGGWGEPITGNVPVFRDIDDVRQVYELVAAQRQKAAADQ